MTCNAADLTIRRNNTLPPVVWGIGPADDPFPLDGSAFILSIFFLGSTTPTVPAITKTSADGGLVIDLDLSTVTWTPTLAEANSIPNGAMSNYTLDRVINSTRQTFISGAVTGAI